jgi:hypothetical protein
MCAQQLLCVLMLQESAIYCVGLYHGLLKLFNQPVSVNFSNTVSAGGFFG